MAIFAGVVMADMTFEVNAPAEVVLDSPVSAEMTLEVATAPVVIDVGTVNVSSKGDTGAPGRDGRDGRDGQDGRDAYMLARAHGFTGTVEEWLASLKGEPGETGARGEKGERGVQGEPGPRGPQGVRGDRGETGVQGERGPAGLAGAKGETGAQGVQGLPGPAGVQGPPGPRGERGPAGTTDYRNLSNRPDLSVYMTKTDRPRIVAAGSLNLGTIGRGSSSITPVSIPQQPDANYSVILQTTSDVGYWTWARLLAMNKTNRGFAVKVYNDSTGGDIVGLTADYVVVLR